MNVHLLSANGDFYQGLDTAKDKTFVSILGLVTPIWLRVQGPSSGSVKQQAALMLTKKRADVWLASIGVI